MIVNFFRNIFVRTLMLIALPFGIALLLVGSALLVALAAIIGPIWIMFGSVEFNETLYSWGGVEDVEDTE